MEADATKKPAPNPPAELPKPKVVERFKKSSPLPSTIEKELRSIYGYEGPTDFKKIDLVKKRGPWPMIIGIVIALFVLAAISWAGLLRFGGGSRYNDRVSIGIEGQQNVRAGDAQTWTITYRNDEQLPIARAEINLRLPQSVTIITTEPQPTTAPVSWSLGTLKAGESGKIVIRGRTLDSLDAPLSIQVVMNYRPANFNADFQKISTWSGRVADSAIEAKLTAPEEAIPSEDDSYKIEITKRGDLTPDAALPNLTVRFDPDNTLVVKKADPAFTKSDERSWTATPPTETPLAFTVTGSFASNATGDMPIRVLVGALKDGGEFVTLVSAEATVKVLEGDLILTLIRNGSAGPATIDLGGALHISVDYENKSDKPITDASIELKISGYPQADGKTTVDWSTFSDLRNGKRDGNTIRWTKKEIPDLGKLEPGDKGSIDVSIIVVDSVFTTADRNYGVNLSASGTIGTLGTKRSGKTVSTPVLTTLIDTDAKITAVAVYSGGALPPKAGTASDYKIVWTITNSLHEIAGIKVTTTLPNKVEWKGNENVTAGDLRYDGGSRTVTWTLNRLPTSITNVSVDFLVQATPDNDYIGSIMPLTEESAFTAVDKTTNTTLTRKDGPLDTNVADDPEHSGQGTVQP